ncbi:phosphotransferase [Guptibacillus algicola]|uniref:phosphotransferase n=1 Tax=Guptibacillus algicola TaxID=225844 RepID=UPI001CD47A22|nr:phosphotransferase [Alkalihalobacillus algicola]MCA0987392.1 aminoglycoside phosphotransferase family protein [Alkalihalobacillus algicola]
MNEQGWKLLDKKQIHGAHAGNLYRVHVVDDKGRRRAFVYKEFEENRNNEVHLYKVLSKPIGEFSKVVNVWDSVPQALLMHDLGSSLKESFPLLTMEGKKKIIDEVLERLSDLHTSELEGKKDELPLHKLTFEWRDWCIDELRKLSMHVQWADGGWITIIERAYDLLEGYQIKCPLVLTHGDPHLDNIFHKEDEIWFIDWEWAALGSPLRDITLFIQDMYDVELIQNVYHSYLSMLKEKGLSIEAADYEADFNHLYADHLVMMIAWEIHKYFDGHISEEELKRILSFKFGELIKIIEKVNT